MVFRLPLYMRSGSTLECATPRMARFSCTCERGYKAADKAHPPQQAHRNKGCIMGLRESVDRYGKPEATEHCTDRPDNQRHLPIHRLPPLL